MVSCDSSAGYFLALRPPFSWACCVVLYWVGLSSTPKPPFFLPSFASLKISYSFGTRIDVSVLAICLFHWCVFSVSILSSPAIRAQLYQHRHFLGSDTPSSSSSSASPAPGPPYEGFCVPANFTFPFLLSRSNDLQKPKSTKQQPGNYLIHSPTIYPLLVSEPRDPA
ncbi:hypothetical protein QBC45DRAFT_43553 [Copromyces sp. CBS 386.78]|nr:hypothetical protein QBC45DRAFT_43553 [Copromyces sp. CBS 386.78]